MPAYTVVIRGTVIKTFQIEAESRGEASEAAHELFTTDCNGDEDSYDEEAIFIAP